MAASRSLTSSGASLTLARSCEERVPTWRHAHAAMRGSACGALLTRGRRNGTHSSASSWAATAHARTVLRPETLVELSNCGREHIRRGAQTCKSELRRWPRGGGALSSDRAPLYINNRRGHFFEKLLLWKLVFSFDGRAVARRVEPCWNTLCTNQPFIARPPLPRRARRERETGGWALILVLTGTSTLCIAAATSAAAALATTKAWLL